MSAETGEMIFVAEYASKTINALRCPVCNHLEKKRLRAIQMGYDFSLKRHTHTVIYLCSNCGNIYGEIT